MIVDYAFNSANHHYSPNGIIRIVRFQRCFWLKINEGYYGDIYMKQFIRIWKRKTYENIQRKYDKLNTKNVLEEQKMICSYIQDYIIKYL
jgi:hypothetical protein